MKPNIINNDYKKIMIFDILNIDFNQIDPNCSSRTAMGQFSCIRGYFEFARNFQHYLFQIYL